MVSTTYFARAISGVSFHHQILVESSQPLGRDLTPSHMGGPASCIRCYTLLIVCSPTILPVLNITFIIVGVVSSPGVFCHAGLVSHYLVTAM